MFGFRNTASLAVALAVLAACPAAIAQPAGSAVIDGRQWALTTSGEDLGWREADAFCRNLRLDGYDDWRLPTLTELTALADPAAVGGSGTRHAIEIDTCCLWSATSLAERPAEGGGSPAAAPSQYYWGIVFDGGIGYYSNQVFADGQALCTRDAG